MPKELQDIVTEKVTNFLNDGVNNIVHKLALNQFSQDQVKPTPTQYQLTHERIHQTVLEELRKQIEIIFS